MTEKIETNSKVPKLESESFDRFRVSKCKNSFNKGYTKNWSREIFIINSALKTNPWTYKMKVLNGEKIIGSFGEKKFLFG